MKISSVEKSEINGCAAQWNLKSINALSGAKKQLKNKGGVYLIRNRVSNMSYVGSSGDLYARIMQHRSSLNRNLHHCKLLQQAYCVDADAFDFVVVQYYANDVERLKLEEKSLKYYGKRNLMYNVSWRVNGGAIAPYRRLNLKHRGLRPNLQALGLTQLPDGVRITKAMRFTLPEKLADKLEAMQKKDKDQLLFTALSS